jgi:hypothetical protein
MSIWIYSTRKKNKYFFVILFGVLVPALTTRKKYLGQYKFFSKDLVETKLYPHKANKFPHLQKKFQKITMKLTS